MLGPTQTESLSLRDLLLMALSRTYTGPRHTVSSNLFEPELRELLTSAKGLCFKSSKMQSKHPTSSVTFSIANSLMRNRQDRHIQLFRSHTAPKGCLPALQSSLSCFCTRTYAPVFQKMAVKRLVFLTSILNHKLPTRR